MFSMLQNWWQQILNHFDGRFNNGFAEGVNLKIRMLNRRGYGYLLARLDTIDLNGFH
jgi:transposase